MTTKFFTQLSKILLAATIFLVPVFFLPLTADFFIFPKINLFIVMTLLSFLSWLAAGTAAKKLELKINPFLYPLLLIAAINLLSFLLNFNSIDKMTGLWSLAPFFFFPLFSFLLTALFDADSKLVKNLLLAVAVIASLLSIYLFFLPTATFPLSFPIFGYPVTILSPNFFPLVNGLVSLIFFVSLLPILVEKFFEMTEKDKPEGKGFWVRTLLKTLVGLIIVTGLGIFIFQIFLPYKTGSRLVNLPYKTGWIISVETLKNPLNALIGVGPGQYLSAFTRFKPMDFNSSNFWQTRFTSSSNEIFQILTTLGLIGFTGYLFLLLRFVKNRRRNPFSLAASVILLSLVFLPANFLLYFFLVIYFSLNNAVPGKTFNLSKQIASIIFIIGTTGSFFIFYFLIRGFLADISFRRSLTTTAENLGIETYNLQIKAISGNPYNSLYHQVYSQTNLALANSLAANSPKDGLSDQDRQTVTQLIQQSIREARNAVSLAPQNINAWENLATIYQQLINLAQGADQWAVTCFNQATRLDPNNPQAYLNLGGLFYSLNRFDEAGSLFQTSVALKPDFANGWYNLAAVFKNKKDYQKAFDSLNQAARFVPLDSQDYQKVQKEIEEIKPKLPPSQAGKTGTGGETLKLPEPLPEPKAKITPIQLPKPEEATQSSQ